MCTHTLRSALINFATVCLLMIWAIPLVHAQDLSLVIDPAVLTLEIGETTMLSAQLVDENGAVQEGQVTFFSRARRSLSVDRQTGELTAIRAGTFQVFASYRSLDGVRYMESIRVTIPFPPLETISLEKAPAEMYKGTHVQIEAEITDMAGQKRTHVEVAFTSSDESIASVDRYGSVHARSNGTVIIEATAEGITGTLVLRVVDNPISYIEISGGPARARTGDVISFHAVARDGNGNAIEDAPIQFSFVSRPSDNLAPSASGQIELDGRFVAEDAGLFTILASVGAVSARHTVDIVTRDAGREVELIGHGTVGDVNTSDLWIWEGVDGRDYAITGTWSAKGDALFWDVTDAANPTIIDTVTVDARTVNDVKVTEDGSVCVISREGASNRKNGLVILDCTDPHNVSTLAVYDFEMTGGVHNLFIYERHIYALSAGRRYDIISIEDPASPTLVGSFAVPEKGSRIHDVWVEDGIAYSSNWADGVYMVDVGNGIKGGSPSNPVIIGHYAYPSGWNHAAFPYRSKETGKFYIIAGDEAANAAGEMMGYAHFIDFTDPENPFEVARYEVPEAGSHNLWVEDDKLYIAYYQGGLRVVDISGDLMGDLYKQGREIARYLGSDPDGKDPNTPMAWGPQPYKGNIFFSDMSSGLWVIKIKEREEDRPGT